MARGYNVMAHILKAAFDGQELNALWADAEQILEPQSDAHRDPLALRLQL